MSDPASTPMMQQYRELKARDPDALLLFRMGDFYELFFEDAERAAALLGLTLTSRDKGPVAIPMAGFPHPALEQYLARIVTSGHRAAVCEQVEDARQAKGLVRREVVRVVTPGTLTDDALLDPSTANYLAAVVEQKGKLGLAWVELSTGRFSLCEAQRRELLDEVARLDPAEILISETAIDAPWVRLLRQQAPHRVITPPALLGLPARGGPQGALRPLRRHHPLRLRRRRRRARGDRRRRPARLPPRHPEVDARPPDPADPAPPRPDDEPRRDGPPEPGADADPPRGQTRRLPARRRRPHLHPDGRPAASPSG